MSKWVLSALRFPERMEQTLHWFPWLLCRETPLCKTAPGRAPGYSGSTGICSLHHHSQVDKAPQGVQEHFAAALLSALWFCFHSHLRCAKCKCPCQCPLPCAGTHMSLTHTSLCAWCRRAGLMGHPNSNADPHCDASVESQRC